MREPYKSALIALIITMVIVSFGAMFTMSLAHSVSVGLVLTCLAYWPAMLVFDIAALEHASDALLYSLAAAAEYLYVFAIVGLVRWIFHMRRGKPIPS
jgi:hypothetical protein